MKWEIPIVTMPAKDSVRFTRDYDFFRTYFLGDVMSINRLRYGNIHRAVIYVKDTCQCDPFEWSLKFYSKDSVDLIIEEFYHLYDDIGLQPPPRSNPYYENDLIAEKFDIRHIEFTNNDYRHSVESIDSVFSGELTFKWVNGNLRCTRSMQNGFLNGIQKDFDTDGTLIYEGNFVNGKKEGVHNTYDEFGKLAVQENYKNGAEDGVQKAWWPNGKKNWIAKFKDGMLISEKYYDENGRPQK